MCPASLNRALCSQDASSAETWQAFQAAGLEVGHPPSSGSIWEHKALCEAAGLILQTPPDLSGWSGAAI